MCLGTQASKIFDDRRKMNTGDTDINWGFAESMSYATLLSEGYPIRITGQDVRRGTFSHRHACVFDSNTGMGFIPLSEIARNNETRFDIYDSLLSEEAVLGFEYGYSATWPSGLTIWEAQFGDFANGAQVVIDQFIVSAQHKWERLSGLVMLLPHGYEGQGPEHSSARIERFLQLCASENIQVCVPSSPKQIFHLLRRQAIRKMRTPLIVISPKSLLRNPNAVSTINDLTLHKMKCLVRIINMWFNRCGCKILQILAVFISHELIRGLISQIQQPRAFSYYYSNMRKLSMVFKDISSTNNRNTLKP